MRGMEVKPPPIYISRMLPRRPRSTLRNLVTGLFIAAAGLPTAVSAQESSPRQTSNVEWWEGLAAIGGYALLTTLDGPVQRFASGHRSEGGDDFSVAVRKMGQPEVFATASLGLLATGLLSGNRKIRDVGVRVTAGLALTGVLVTAAKLTAGRTRPSKDGSDSDDFAPFSGGTSAPSGHTAMAFALATSLSDAIKNPWVTALLYTGATGTAWSRVNDNAHRLSDVVAGAALGIVSARFMDGKLTLLGIRAPAIGPTSNGLSLSWQGAF